MTLSVAKPAGAKKLTLTFGYFDASNNWWWAIDNVKLTSAAGVELFVEDFEGLALGGPVDEVAVVPARSKVWTAEPPAGWVNDVSGVPGAGTDNDGMTEWAGWSFTNKDWWVRVAGDQERSQFELGYRVVAVADSDEWDDAGHPDGAFNAFLSTPPIDISNMEPGSVKLRFDSSWRQEATQTASVTVQYDAGQPIVVMLWESEGSNPNGYKADATSETVTVDLHNPAGANTIVITFGVTDADNNWWWAIDNVEVLGTFTN